MPQTIRGTPGLIHTGEKPSAQLLLSYWGMKEGYSLAKFRRAQREGKRDLETEELDFLDRYKRTEAEMRKGRAEEEMPRPFAVVGHMLLDMLKRERREVIFGAGRAAELQAKRVSTMEGQIELAHGEASALNEEYDRRADDLRRAVQDFQAFLDRINSRK